ncbi:MAG: outer membrane beta-barrel protein [Prevotella sp.]|nr:outer membrane beta-barrel protein [Prevotella sp.]
MKRKIMVVLAALTMAVAASAQHSDIGPFDQGKIYVGASLTGLNLSYNGQNHLNLGIGAQAGYTVADNLMLLGQVNFQHSGSDAVADEFKVGVGGRYYIIQNGLYLGANCNLVHQEHSVNDVRPSAEVGYAFFVSRTVTIEPAVYYEQSFKSHSKYSSAGLKVGIGVYLFKD